MKCTACHLDREKHSKDMWKLHQEPQPCAFCNKSSDKHSERLWEIHTSVVVKGRYCNVHKKIEKLYPFTVGLARTGVARVCKTIADPSHDVNLIPIYMSCTNCGLYLGSIEEDYADVLDGMCLSCFREVIEQEGSWCDY